MMVHVFYRTKRGATKDGDLFFSSMDKTAKLAGSFYLVSIPGLVLSFIAEVSITLWLSIKGVQHRGPALREAS